MGHLILRFRCKLSYLAGRPMGNELLFRLRFLEDRAKSTWLPQTAAGPRSSRQGIIYETDANRSPDQNSLVFGGVPWLEGGAAGSAVIHMLDLKTREVSILSGSEGLYSPHWSPDGRFVLFAETDAVRLQHSQVGRIGKQSCGLPELVPRWE